MYPAELAGYSGHVIPSKVQSDQCFACERLTFIQVDVTRETRHPLLPSDRFALDPCMTETGRIPSVDQFVPTDCSKVFNGHAW